MKIAMLGSRGLPATHGGVERAVEELSARLADRGHDVTVFCRPAYCAERLPTHRGVRLRRLPAIPTKHLEAASHTFLGALAAAVGDYDVVHIHSIGPALFGLIPRLAGKRLVVTVHALDWKRRKWGLLARLALRAGARSATLFPHATIAVSRAAQRHLKEAYRREPLYLPNGVSFHGNGRQVASAEAAPGQPPYLLFLGRLVPEKRVHDLIAAFRAWDTEARLLIAGDGQFSNGHVGSLRRQASGDSRIAFTGGVYGERKEALLAGAAALVNPSELEGHPIVVLEALAHGLPVVVSDIEEHREILEAEEGNGFLGLTFRTGDRVDLRGALARSLSLDGDPDAPAARRRFVAERFEWGRIAAATEQVYRTIVLGRRRPC
ncbi:MAG TPA: glycosyltransferase family 4 protein [Candidatus Polarisedimenticolia bacterium]|jgi:glycosyltransferase involved in cell wall biosynthesis|nr:glycosyltransferase family 4 protein [Candidatus Polarisedimenticolia bacterium]